MSAVLATDYVGIYKQAVNHTLANPKWFFNNVLHYDPLPWQLRAIDAVLDVRRKQMRQKTRVNHKGRPRVSIRSCHGPGKTQFLALLMHLWNFTTYGKIACTAPKHSQLTRRLMPRYRAAMQNAEPTYKTNIDTTDSGVACFGDRDWGAVMETASDPDNLSGYHDRPQLFLIDEASARRLDPMYPVIEGAITTPGSCIVEIGNPTRVDGEFYRHHTKPGIKDLYYLMHIKHTDAPQLVSKAWIEAMAQKYGRESPVFLIRCLGEFASFDEYVLIQPEYIDEAMDSEPEPDGSHPRVRVSVDVADGGMDSTVITTALHYQSYKIMMRQTSHNFPTGRSPKMAAEAAFRMFEAFGGHPRKGDDFVVDGLGVGAGTVGELMGMEMDGIKMNVINFKGGEASDDQNRWRNRRVQGYMSLEHEFSYDTWHIHPDCFEDDEAAEEFRAQLLSIKRREPSGNEKTEDIMPKNSIKADGLPSPDRADSAMMQCAGEAIAVDDTSPIMLFGGSQMMGVGHV